MSTFVRDIEPEKQYGIPEEGAEEAIVTADSGAWPCNCGGIYGENMMHVWVDDEDTPRHLRADLEVRVV